MYISVAVYLLVLAVVLWGGRFAGFKGKFHDDFMSLESTRAVRGLAALGVIFHHISQENAFQKIKVIQVFLNMGPAFVAVFFFCSGFGLIKCLNTRPDYLHGFLKRRVVKGILIPFYVNVIIYGIFHLIYGTHFEPLQWVTNLLGFTMMNKYAWFPIVLFLLYMAFYFVYRNIKNRRLCLFLMFLVVLGQGVFFCVWGHFAWWAGDENWWLSPSGMASAKWWMKEFTTWFFGQWWVNSTIGFIMGMLYAEHEESVTAWFKKGYWVKLVGLFVCVYVFMTLSAFTQFKFGYYTEYMGHGPGIGAKLITYLSQLPQIGFWVIVVFVVRMKYKANNPVLRFFGKYSLDTYLMNLIPLIVFEPLIQRSTTSQLPIYKPGNCNLALYIALVLAATVVLGVIEHKIVKNVSKRL